MSDQAFIAQRLAWRFASSGGAGEKTGPFQDFSTAIQEGVRAGAKLSSDDVPAVLCFLGAEHWVLLSTQSLVVRDGHGVSKMPLTSIENATAPMAPGGKLGMHELVLSRSEAPTKVRIDVEPGRACIGFLNALLAALP